MRKAILLAVLVVASTAHAQLFENFNTFPPPGWIVNNQSSPLGTTSWFQGNPAVFPAQFGASNSYAGANFNSTSNVGTISTWLISPQFHMEFEDEIIMWTRTVTTPAFPDRLEVRLSPTGGSDPGVGPNSTGDFSVLLFSVNPNLTLTGYPNTWTRFRMISTFNFPTARLALRYFVTDAGPNGANSDYIGVDSLMVDYVPEPGTLGLVVFAGFYFRRRRGKLRQRAAAADPTGSHTNP